MKRKWVECFKKKLIKTWLNECLNFRSFHKISLAILILTAVTSCQSSVISLKCSMMEYVQTGKTCELKQKELIIDIMIYDTFEYTGIDANQSQNIKTILFRNRDVSFIPKETTKYFPNLNGVALIDSIEVIDSHWAERLFRYWLNQITKLYLLRNQISRIDAKMMKFFSRFTEINLEGNVCVNENFEIPVYTGRKNMTYFHMKIMPCFQNYISHQIDALETSFMKRSVENYQILNNLKVDMKDQEFRVNEKLRKLEKTIVDLAAPVKDLVTMVNEKWETMSRYSNSRRRNWENVGKFTEISNFWLRIWIKATRNYQILISSLWFCVKFN